MSTGSFVNSWLIDDYGENASQPQPFSATTAAPAITSIPDQNAISPVADPQRKSSLPPLHVRSCVTCRRRKVRASGI
jgi:hypothetical protein